MKDSHQLPSISKSHSSVEQFLNMAHTFILTDKFDENETVLSCQIRHSWIGHGLFAGMVSLFTTLVSGMPVSHWWVTIQTDKGFYNSQFYGFNDSFLSLTKHDNPVKANEAGTGFLIHEKGVMKFEEGHAKNRKMRDVLEFMRNWNPTYSLLSNNCQHFSRKLFHLLTTLEEEGYIGSCQSCFRETRHKHLCVDCHIHYKVDCLNWVPI